MWAQTSTRIIKSSENTWKQRVTAKLDKSAKRTNRTTTGYEVELIREITGEEL